jgi:hypothetical protein
VTTKDRLKDLIDQLPDRELYAVRRFIEFLRESSDPMLDMLLEAPEEDAQLSEETLTALDDAERGIRSGALVPHEELKRELGLRPGGYSTQAVPDGVFADSTQLHPGASSLHWIGWRQLTTEMWRASTAILRDGVSGLEIGGSSSAMRPQIAP